MGQTGIFILEAILILIFVINFAIGITFYNRNPREVIFGKIPQRWLGLAGYINGLAALLIMLLVRLTTVGVLRMQLSFVLFFAIFLLWDWRWNSGKVANIVLSRLNRRMS